jgi:protoheme IX farnesyltransferase
MGWSAATGGSMLDVEALLLGGTLYYWQLPHFMALSYMHRIDYARGGFEMVPVNEENGEETSKIIVRNTWLLSTMPVLATLTNVTSSMFALEGLLLNGYALHVAYQFQQDRTNAKARKVFLTSLWYLPTFLMLFLLHAKTWDEKESEDNVLREYISTYVHIIREKGRELCLHETALEKSVSMERSCPIVIAKITSNKAEEENTATHGHVQCEKQQ